MTAMNRTKRLARSIQQDKGWPYTMALREAKRLIAEEREGVDSEGLDRGSAAHPVEREG